MPTSVGLQYLDAARQAFYYTGNKLVHGTTNKPLEAITQPVRQLNAMNVFFKTRNEVDKALEDRFVSDTDPYRRVQIMAEKAEKYGFGNCEEQSSVAYMYLSRLSRYPIDWCRWKVGFHAFVLVGRPAGKFDVAKIPSLPWFKDAVICDPQDKRVGYWSDMVSDYPVHNVIPMLHQEPGKVRDWINL